MIPDDHRFQSRQQSQAEPVHSGLGFRLGLRAQLDLFLDRFDVLDRHLSEPHGHVFRKLRIERDLLLVKLPHQVVRQPEEKVGIVIVRQYFFVGRVEVQWKELRAQIMLEPEQLRGLAAATMAGERNLGEGILSSVVVLQADPQQLELIGSPAPRQIDVAGVTQVERPDDNNIRNILQSAALAGIPSF